MFLLSIDEAKQYFDSNEQRSAFITKYAEEKGKRFYLGFRELYIEFIENREKNYKGKWWYWLRSPAECQCYASFIEVKGFIANHNTCFDDGGVAGWDFPELATRECGGTVNYENGIRPVIWVKI